MLEYDGEITNELFEILELVDYTLSSKFTKKWKWKYSEQIIRLFQEKLLFCLKDNKPIKINSLTKELMTKTHYNKIVINEFYEDIVISLYFPLVF